MMSNWATLFTRSTLTALVVLGLSAAASATAAGSGSQEDCRDCVASAPTVGVDPSSYKLWPSGSRTFLTVQWAPDGAAASFNILNLGGLPSPAFTATVEVSNHDPLTQTPIDRTLYSYPIAALAVAGTMTLRVPLDPMQCDIFVSVDLGTGSPIILRTGNPAVC